MGHKHKMKIVGADDQWLVGWVFFKCEYCAAGVMADRPALYSMMTRSYYGQVYGYD